MSHISPYPIHGGENIRAAGLIKLLSQLGPTHAIVGDCPTLQIPSSTECPNVQFYPFDFESTMKPVVRYYFQQSELKAHIESILQQHPIQYAWIDYQFYGNYISLFHEHGIPVVYGTHNAESWMACEEMRRSTGFAWLKQKLLFYQQYWHERLYFDQTDWFVVVSDEDAHYYAPWVASEKTHVIPNFIDTSCYGKTAEPDLEQEPVFVMTANFTVFQNQDGAQWFLEKVWAPFELHTRGKLRLIGRGSQEFLQEFPEAMQNNVEATGAVPNIAKFMEDAAVALVPILHGSGTRLKILEAMHYGIPIVSTSLGAQGIEGDHEQHFLLADTPEIFAQSIEKALSPTVRTTLISNATQLLSQKYTLDANLKKVQQFLGV